VPRQGDGAAAAVSSARDAVTAAEAALAAAGCDTPRLDAELLIADALGVDRSALVTEPDMAVSPTAARRAMERVRRRVAREPVAYILGRRGFRRLELMVDARALVPRPETELLVEVAVATVPRGAWVHDAGTGCGAVALALADERPDLLVSASDASADAVAVARANAARLGLDVEVAVARDLPWAGPDVLSLVTANMPYVREDEWPLLAPEIRRYEPRAALVGGPDGLAAIRGLLVAAPRGTLLALEHAPDQGSAVRALLHDAETHRDLAGRERVTVGRAP
jgi:release factor glutamine methyltransferase